MPMGTSNQQTIETLNDLLQLDTDAVILYEQAIEHVEGDPLRMDLELFQADHERHITDLRQLVLDLGGQPIEIKRDLKGAVLQAVTAMRSLTGTKGALKAMRMNEKLTNRTYEKAMQGELPVRVSRLVAQNLDDERRHLATIEAHIERLRLGGEVDQDLYDDDDAPGLDEIDVVEVVVVDTDPRAQPR
jgi:rubrerythrin